MPEKNNMLYNRSLMSWKKYKKLTFLLIHISGGVPKVLASHYPRLQVHASRMSTK